MSMLAPVLQSFFTDRLTRQRQVSQHTIAAYRDTFRLLLAFAEQHTGHSPSHLQLEELDAPLIGAFLDHLETERKNSTRTRNSRLAAVHSLFRFAALRDPEHAALIQRVLAIPQKRAERNLVTFLDPIEVDALIAAPDRNLWVGRRDHTLLVTAIQTGLRVSEIVSLCCQDLELRRGAHIRCEGKGRKERVTPLTDHTASVLRTWLSELQRPANDPAVPRPARQGAHPRCRWPHRFEVCDRRTDPVPIAGEQEGLPTRAAPHLCHATLARGCGHLRDRALARS